MTDADDRLDRVRALIARELELEDGVAVTARRLSILCRVAARVLPAWGVAVSLMTERGPTGVVASLNEESEVVEELAFILGEGPCWEAFETRAPVMEPDLLGEGARRWPGFGAAVRARGVRSVFAFPLQVGSARLGVMDVYREQPGALAPETVADALALAHIATLTLLDGQDGAGEGAAPPGIEQVLEARFIVYQAQGMVMVQLDVLLPEAMARLRAHAYTHDRTLGAVAREIVNGTLSLEADER